MTKADKIHIKIELCKDINLNKLEINTLFDAKSPNFSKDDKGFFWMPTVEERDFINEAYELVPTDKPITPSETITETPEKKDYIKSDAEETTVNKEQTLEPEIKIEQSIPVSSPESEVKKPVIEEIKSSEMPSSFEKKNDSEGKPADASPIEKRQKEEIFEIPDEESETAKGENNTSEENEVLVEVDQAAISAALRKKEERDKSMVEADEDTIVERVLNQKKKGKWSKRK